MLPQSETVADSLGGGGLIRPLAALSRGLGAPLETVLPYDPSGGYQSADAGDAPVVNDWWNSHPQRLINDFNLSDAPQPYVFQPPT